MMKTIMNTLLALGLILTSLSSFADKIVLTGRPAVLIPQADYFIFPKDYTQLNKYPFVKINDVERVCFLSKVPEFARLDMLRFYIVQNHKKFLWFCYRYDPRYFTINF